VLSAAPPRVPGEAPAGRAGDDGRGTSGHNLRSTAGNGGNGGDDRYDAALDQQVDRLGSISAQVAPHPGRLGACIFEVTAAAGVGYRRLAVALGAAISGVRRAARRYRGLSACGCAGAARPWVGSTERAPSPRVNVDGTGTSQVLGEGGAAAAGGEGREPHPDAHPGRGSALGGHVGGCPPSKPCGRRANRGPFGEVGGDVSSWLRERGSHGRREPPQARDRAAAGRTMGREPARGRPRARPDLLRPARARCADRIRPTCMRSRRRCPTALVSTGCPSPHPSSAR
jgi:hypothetical protein